MTSQADGPLFVGPGHEHGIGQDGEGTHGFTPTDSSPLYQRVHRLKESHRDPLKASVIKQAAVLQQREEG